MSNDSNDIVEARILNDPGEGFKSRDVIYSIAKRLISHTAGKIIGGYGKSKTPDGKDGKMLPLSDAYAPGDLILSDALYAVEYALSRGLNPYGHIHLWYQRTKKSPTPTLIIDIDYKVLKGWAEMRQPFRTETFTMTPDERATYGLKPNDLGAVAYNILDADVNFLHQFKMQFLSQGMSIDEANRLAAQATKKSSGVGVVRASEMKTSAGKHVPAPKARPWQWRAEIRAMRDAIRRSHGDPPPAQIKQYAETQFAIGEQQLNLLAAENFPADLPPEDQQNYLQIAAHTESGAKHDLAAVNAVLRNNGDDDPLELADETEAETEEAPADQEPAPPPNVPPELAEFRQTLLDKAAKIQRKGPAVDIQHKLIIDKISEIDGEIIHLNIVSWIFGEGDLKFNQAKVLLKTLLLSQNKETGVYPLNPKIKETIKGIHKQYQLEQGQLELPF